MGVRVIDADAHVNEDALGWTELEDRHPGWLSAGRSGDRWVASIGGKLYPVQEGPGCGVAIDASTSPACAAGAADLDQRLADMDAEGIDVQVLFGGLAIGLPTFDDHGFALDFARSYNDWLLAKICAHAPERLKGVAVVPVQAVDLAVEELRRAAGLGAVAVTIPPVLDESRNLDDPSLLPFFEAAESEDLAVCIHSAPGMNVPLPAAGRFANYAQVHCLSFPADQMTALTALALGGVLDRFPRLRVGFMESGIGWVPYFVHRLHEHVEKLPHLLPGISDPRDLLARGQCFFSFEAEEPLLGTCVDELGAGPWVYASDYPHWDSDFPGTVEECRDKCAAADLTADDTAAVLGGNAARLYGLG